jgi:hypothetical protein
MMCARVPVPCGVTLDATDLHWTRSGKVDARAHLGTGAPFARKSGRVTSMECTR